MADSEYEFETEVTVKLRVRVRASDLEKAVDQIPRFVCLDINNSYGPPHGPRWSAVRADGKVQDSVYLGAPERVSAPSSVKKDGELVTRFQRRKTVLLWGT